MSQSSAVTSPLDVISWQISISKWVGFPLDSSVDWHAGPKGWITSPGFWSEFIHLQLVLFHLFWSRIVFPSDLAVLAGVYCSDLFIVSVPFTIFNRLHKLAFFSLCHKLSVAMVPLLRSCSSISWAWLVRFMCTVSGLCNDINYPQTLMNDELLLLQFKMFPCVLFSFSFNIVLKYIYILGTGHWSCVISHCGGQIAFRVWSTDFFPPSNHIPAGFLPNPAQQFTIFLKGF